MELKKFRKQKGVLQSDIARALGLNNSTYAYYERGERTPSPDLLCAFADYFEITVDELLGHHSSQELFDDARIPKTEIQELFDQMTPEQQNHILIYAQGLVAGNSLDKHNKGVKVG